MSDSVIAEIRAFNRFYTRQIGLLNEYVANSRFSLAEGRVLYEVARRGHTTGAALTQALNLDPAYLSRILQKFLGQELVLLSPSPTDRRANRIALSADGDAAVAELDELNDAAVEGLLAHVAPADRDAIVAAMQTIRTRLGDAPQRGPVILRPHRIGELGWLVHRQAVLYNRQHGWNGEFEALIAKLYHDYEAAPASPPRGLWIAERQGSVAGSVFVVPSDGRPGTAQLRMLYVEPEARGLGIGRLLVDQCISFARDSGYRRLRLWTQSILVPARRIYAAAGFHRLDSTPHHSFGASLEGENWELEL